MSDHMDCNRENDCHYLARSIQSTNNTNAGSGPMTDVATNSAHLSSAYKDGWSPYGLCSSPPARRKVCPSTFSTATDRFIPCRAPLDTKFSNFLLSNYGDVHDCESSPSRQDYMNTLKQSVLEGQADAMVLPLRPRETADQPTGESFTSFLSSENGSMKRRRTTRFIPKSPDKILDAPDLVDDYYLNLLDWSKSNILAVALRQSVFLWNASNGAAHKLMETSGRGNIVTSLAWGDVPSGNTLAVGTHFSEVQLWDVTTGTVIRQMGGHRSRVSSMSWNGQVHCRLPAV